MKIYTKRGDRGETSLVSGRRLSKADVLIEAYGTVDELNAHIGDLLLTVDDEGLISDLQRIQNILFNIGSLLAKDGAKIDDYPSLETKHVRYLEDRIDQMNGAIERLTAFILPQGSPGIVKAHICRTICRRAERRVVLIEEAESQDLIIQYLNRLSDYLFVVARYLHNTEDIREVKWSQ